MSMNKLVYLAGPILGQTYDEAADWRERARVLLQPDGITCLSPLRGKSFLRTRGVLEQDVYPNVLARESAIVQRDFFDVARCAVVLANFLGAERASIGTCFEVAWAFAGHKPVVAVLPEGGIHDHAFVRRVVGFRVDTLDEAVGVVRHIILPEGG